METHNEFIVNFIKELNLVRTNPISYANKLLEYESLFRDNILYLRNHKPIMFREGFKIFREASNYLMRCIPMSPLIVNPSLTNISNDIFNNKSLKIEDAIEKYGQVVGEFSYVEDSGSSTYEALLLNLLIDDSDSNRPNRRNLLNKSHRAIGIYHNQNKDNHNEVIYSTSISFARRFYMKNEEIGELSDENYDYTGGYSNNKEKFELDKGILNEERIEKLIIEDGRKKKLVKITKTMDDGSVKTEIRKEEI